MTILDMIINDNIHFAMNLKKRNKYILYNNNIYTINEFINRDKSLDMKSIDNNLIIGEITNE